MSNPRRIVVIGRDPRQSPADPRPRDAVAVRAGAVVAVAVMELPAGYFHPDSPAVPYLHLRLECGAQVDIAGPTLDQIADAMSGMVPTNGVPVVDPR